MSDCHQPPYRWAPLSAPAQGKFLCGPAGESSTVCPNGVSKHESGGRLSPCPRSFWSHGSGAVVNRDVNLQRLHSDEPRCLILRACLALPHLGQRISIASDCWEPGAQSGWCSGGGRRRVEVRAVFTPQNISCFFIVESMKGSYIVELPAGELMPELQENLFAGRFFTLTATMCDNKSYQGTK